MPKTSILPHNSGTKCAPLIYTLWCGGGGANRPPLVRGGICVAGAEANRWRLRVGRGIERERNKRSLIKRGSAAEGPQTAPGNLHRCRVQGSRHSHGKSDVRPKFGWVWDACAAFKVDNVRNVVRARGLSWTDVCRILRKNSGVHLQTLTASLLHIFCCYCMSALIFFKGLIFCSASSPHECLGAL